MMSLHNSFSRNKACESESYYRVENYIYIKKIKILSLEKNDVVQLGYLFLLSKILNSNFESGRNFF